MITIKILDIKTFLNSHVVWLIHDMLVRRINQSAVLWFVRWIRTWKGPISRKPRQFLVILKVLTSAFRYLNFCVAHFKVILTLALRNRSYSITNSSFWIISNQFFLLKHPQFPQLQNPQNPNSAEWFIFWFETKEKWFSNQISLIEGSKLSNVIEALIQLPFKISLFSD